MGCSVCQFNMTISSVTNRLLFDHTITVWMWQLVSACLWSSESSKISNLFEKYHLNMQNDNEVKVTWYQRIPDWCSSELWTAAWKKSTLAVHPSSFERLSDASHPPHRANALILSKNIWKIQSIAFFLRHTMGKEWFFSAVPMCLSISSTVNMSLGTLRPRPSGLSTMIGATNPFWFM